MASFPVVTAIRGRIPQVKAAIHVQPEPMTVNIGERQFRETVTFVDSNFFQVIRLPLAAGDPARVLAAPESIVLSQRTAHKLFGAADPIGKMLVLSQDYTGACAAGDSACLANAYPLMVTGVLRDLPHNTQLVADLVAPNGSRADEMSAADKANDWTALDGDYGYLELRPGADPAAVLLELERIQDSSFDPRRIGIHLPFSEFEQYRLTPFRAVHLTSDQYQGMTPGGSWETVYGLAIIALLIVLIAACNFTNLATARATLRAREIAVRKLGGASRRQLMVQFLLEAVLLSLASLVIALSLVEVLLSAYGRFLDRAIQLRYLTDWPLVAGLIGGAVAVGIASGFYPAVVLSGLRPVDALKAGGLKQPGGPGLLRSALVTAQFAIAIGLGIAALVVLRQVELARQVDLGFDTQGIVVVRGIERLTPSARASLAAALRLNPQITGVAYSNGVPFDLFSISHNQVRASGEPQSISAELINTDPQFPSLYGVKLLAGRLLSERRGEDASAGGAVHSLLINATLARRLGLSPREAVGKELTVAAFATATIVGVLSDTQLDGMREAVQPAVYYFDPGDPHALTRLSIRVSGERTADTLSFIDRTWHAFAPGTAIDRYYLADAFERLFAPDERQGELLGFFVSIAIFIACLGLFGLAVFTAERRTKEIGVRKIAGARTRDLLLLMLWRISMPVLIANLIAWPVAYHYLARWLDGYAYRISLGPMYFLAVGAAALAIAWATVFAHTLRLARASPVHALRYE